MSIELHCPNCNKGIRAPDDAGGKRGLCPSCKQSVYIPSPAAEEDIIPMAAIDEADQLRGEELHQESIGFAAAVDRDRKAKEGAVESQGGARDPFGVTEAPGEVVDLAGDVEQFILAMRDSKLDDAERIAVDLDKAGVRACDYVQGLMLDQMPPKMEGVPQPLVQGFLKALLERLKSGPEVSE